MKDSGIEWIGQIPENWSIYTNKTILTNLYSGGTPASGNQDYYDIDGIPFVSIGDMSKKDYVFSTKSGITEKGRLDKNLKILKNGTILYSIYATIGEVSELKTNACINQAILALFPNNKICQKDFYKYNLKAMKDYIFYEANGNTQFNLNAEKVKNFKFVIPSLNEQNTIANYLDTKCSQIDSILTSLQDQTDTLEQYKKSVITEAVTKGLNPNVEMKDSGIEWIGEIPKKWKISRLKYELECQMQYGASESGIDYQEELPRYIRITDITLDNKLKEEGKLSLTEEQAKNFLLKKETILFARSGATVGKTFLYLPEYGKAAFAGYLISAVTNVSKMLPKWLYYYTLSNSYWSWANRIFTQATVQNIGADKYSNLLITVPEIIEQNQIVNYLDSKCSQIDSIISQKKEQMEILKEYKKSLIYEYVTGKKEVPNA